MTLGDRDTNVRARLDVHGDSDSTDYEPKSSPDNIVDIQGKGNKTLKSLGKVLQLLDDEEVAKSRIGQSTARHSLADSARGKADLPIFTDSAEVKLIKLGHDRLQRDLTDLREDLKAVNRENREQSLELRDLKRQNNQLRERYNSIRRETVNDQKNLVKSERNKHVEHFEMLEDHVAYLQHEIWERDGHLKSLTEQTREAVEEKSSFEAETP